MDEEDRKLVAATTYADADARRAFAQLILTLKDTLVKEQQVTTHLTERIRNLTAWLLIFTIVIGVLTLVQIGVGVTQVSSSWRHGEPQHAGTWVWWVRVGAEPGDFRIVRAFGTQRECQDYLKSKNEEQSPNNSVCLSDTVDPRGAKGGGR